MIRENGILSRLSVSNHKLSSTQVGTLKLVSKTPVELFEARPFCDQQRELRMKARFINQNPKKSLKIIY